MTVTDQQRAEWRAEHAPPLNHVDHRILALLDALEAAREQITDFEEFAQIAIARAESAESERDSLAVQLDEALGKAARVEALAEEIDRHAYTPECGDDRCRECLTAEAIRAALAGPSPTDEGGES